MLNYFFMEVFIMSMYDNAKYIYSYFVSKGWTPQAVCGMLGNMQSESSIEPNVWENGGGSGYGLVQWTPGSVLINWCNSQGLNYTTLAAQCDRIEYEFTHGLQFYPSNSYGMNASQYMHSTDSAYTLGLVFLANYERPANPYQPQRANQAAYWYNQLAGTSTAPVPTPTVTPASGTYTFNQAANIRTEPSLNGTIVGQYQAGQSVNYNGKVNNDGFTWLRYTAYDGKTAYVAEVGGTDSPTLAVTPANGTYTFMQTTNIRTAPNTNAPIVAQFAAGQSVNYNGIVANEGYTWLRYISYTGTTLYAVKSN